MLIETDTSGRPSNAVAYGSGSNPHSRTAARSFSLSPLWMTLRPLAESRQTQHDSIIIAASTTPVKTLTAIAKHIRIRGVVQGVGFRPFVYRLAMRHELTGHVRNRYGDVEILAQGQQDSVDAFLRDLRMASPTGAAIDELVIVDVDPSDSSDFAIRESIREPAARSDRSLSIAPDIATCDGCLQELFDEHDRRHRYPFISCAHCGPRYTIVRAAPWDRERTSMAGFTMCPACQREFDAPDDRRFHAHTNACAECGPQVSLTDAAGTDLPTDDRTAVRWSNRRGQRAGRLPPGRRCHQ